MPIQNIYFDFMSFNFKIRNTDSEVWMLWQVEISSSSKGGKFRIQTHLHTTDGIFAMSKSKNGQNS